MTAQQYRIDARERERERIERASVTDKQRAAELDALFSDLLDRGEPPTWITGRELLESQACVNLEWADLELLRKRCKPWHRRLWDWIMLRRTSLPASYARHGTHKQGATDDRETGRGDI